MTNKRTQNNVKNKEIKLTLVYFLSILYYELVFHIATFGLANLFSFATIYVIIFAFIMTIILSTICHLFHRRTNYLLTLTIIVFLACWFATENVFHHIFNTFFSIHIFGIADQALTFSGTALLEIFKNLPIIFLFFIPYILIRAYKHQINFHYILDKKLYLKKGLSFIILVVFFIILLQVGKGNNYSGYNLFYEVDNNAMDMEKLGVNIATYLDIKKSVLGFNETIGNVDPLTETTEDSKQDTKKYAYNNLDIDFNTLINNDTNKELNNMDEYFSNDTGTLQNEYTGIFKGKNLIVIMGESLNNIAISEKYTPTLYKLSHESFVFDNFYTPINLSTIGGEFQDLTGLFANLGDLSSYWRKGTNYFPFGLATVYKNVGYNTYAYHPNYGTFQDRNVYLKKLGFDNFLYRGNGLEKLMNCNLWPQSDLDMVNVTYDDWVNSDAPFMTYYVSVSGHMPWSWSGNNMAKKNKEALANSNYSEEAAAYIAANMELDKAVQSLIDKLTDAGKLDDTVIAIVPDHYPYSMNLSTINELSTYERDATIEVNHSTLIIWNNKEETHEITKVSSQLDFMPTIYNLFGINYDSRLFMGKDILSTEPGLAYFTNRSWVSDYGNYQAASGTFTKTTDNELSDNYVSNINKIVANRINMSKYIMDTDYYKHVLGE
jgi:lipoteichoic acid synthase